MIGGFEDIGIRFTLSVDGMVDIIVPQNITLTSHEIGQLRAMKPDILVAINRNEVFI
jgi:hypothetical protein